MDTGTILAYALGYFATIAGIFVLYLPIIVLVVGLLIAGGLLQLLILPIAALVRMLRRSPPPDTDASWFLDGKRG